MGRVRPQEGPSRRGSYHTMLLGSHSPRPLSCICLISTTTAVHFLVPQGQIKCLSFVENAGFDSSKLPLGDAGIGGFGAEWSAEDLQSRRGQSTRALRYLLYCGSERYVLAFARACS